MWSWDTVFDLPTILWGGVWGGFWTLFIALWVRGWKRLSPGKQYLLVVLPIGAAMMAPFMVVSWLAYTYYGTNGAVITMGLSPLMWMIFRPMQNEEDEGSWFQRWEHKHFTVRLLWRDNRNRQCKRCGWYDSRTRLVTKPASATYESAFAPCYMCGASDFDFFYLDGSPA